MLSFCLEQAILSAGALIPQLDRHGILTSYNVTGNVCG